MVKDKVKITVTSAPNPDTGLPDKMTEHVTSYDGDQSRMGVEHRDGGVVLTRQSWLPEGSTSNKRMEELAAVERIVPAFRDAHGVALDRLEPDPDDRDADVIGVADGDGLALRFQVVRTRDSKFWKELRTRHKHTDEISQEELYELILHTLDRKKDNAGPDLILVMDIWPHVPSVLVHDFKARHQAEIDGYGFAEIWWSGREEPYLRLKAIETARLPWRKMELPDQAVPTSKARVGLGEGAGPRILVNGKRIK